MSLEDHGPKTYTVKVSKPSDLEIKIARSGAASIEIPELGLRLDPGDESQSFITNIEGILTRFEEALRILGGLDPARSGEVDKHLHQIELAKTGKIPFMVIVEDPLGNTTIIEDYNVT
jgi:zinc finger protein